jgi:hypothetical protein
MMGRRALAIAGLTLAFVACATLGDETAFPDIVQTSGVGPFRLLDATETGGFGAPRGRVLFSREAVGRAMMAEDLLFYPQAEVLDEPPERNPDLPEGVVDPAQVGPSAIHRGMAREVDGEDVFEGAVSFDGGSAILEASESWEGDSLTDPWVHVAADGTARLYYAADGGIGVAEASSASGTFTKVAGPVVTDARAPTVVTFAGETLLFFEATDSGTIGFARSSDGRAFTEETRALDLELAGETALGAPGAVVATTPTGRTMVRLYFEAVTADDVTILSVAATEDLESWDRLETEIGILSTVEDAREPTPFLRDDGITVLLITRQNDSRGVEIRAICGASAPANLSLIPVLEPEE